MVKHQSMVVINYFVDVKRPTNYTKLVGNFISCIHLHKYDGGEGCLNKYLFSKFRDISRDVGKASSFTC